MVEPPYGIIASKLTTGKVIPFLGAGASLGARAPKAEFDPAHPRFLPKSKELAQALADESSFPSNDPLDREDLAKVSSYYVGVSDDGRPTLRQRLRQLLNPVSDSVAANPPAGIKPLALHRLLAALPNRQVIVTTNYDSLIEDAFKEAQKPYDLVIYPADSPQLFDSVLLWQHGKNPQPTEANQLAKYLDLRVPTDPTVIFKMHGTRHPSDETYDHFVITEEDYLEFLSRMAGPSAIPPVFIPHFRERNFLFLGYGLRDWNLRLLLKRLLGEMPQPEADKSPKRADKRLRSWAIQRDASELEMALWRNRDVEIFDADVNDFAAKVALKLGLPL